MHIARFILFYWNCKEFMIVSFLKRDCHLDKSSAWLVWAINASVVELHFYLIFLAVASFMIL